MELPRLDQGVFSRAEGEECWPNNARDHLFQPNYHYFNPSPTESLLLDLRPNLNGNGRATTNPTASPTVANISSEEAHFPQFITRRSCPSTNKIPSLQRGFSFPALTNNFSVNNQHCQSPSTNIVDGYEIPPIRTDNYDFTTMPSPNDHKLIETDGWGFWELSGNANLNFRHPQVDQDPLEDDIAMTCSGLGTNQVDPLWTSWVDNYLGDTVPGSPSQRYTLSSALARGEKPSAALYSGPKPSIQLKGFSLKALKPKKSKPQRKIPSLSKIPLESRQILEDHFQKNPYPAKNETAALAQLTALKPTTVRNWFNNTRARSCLFENGQSSIGKAKTTTTLPSNQVATRNAANTITTEVDAMSIASQSSSIYSLNRYLATSIENEAASALAIKDAICLSRSSSGAWNPKDNWWDTEQMVDAPREEPGDNFSDSLVPRVSSWNSSISLGSSDAGSVSSYNSERARRRGRRRYLRDSYDALKEANKRQKRIQSQKPPFFCTFCGSSYSTKYEWKRHEESVHASPTTWICLPSGWSHSLQKCPFCSEVSPALGHMSIHDHCDCLKKPESERAFNRKDHLQQHIRRVHWKRCSGQPVDLADTLKAWERPAPPLLPGDPALHCGFCGWSFESWKDRVEHVADHFRERLDLSMWWADRKDNTRQFPIQSTVPANITPIWSCSILPGVKSLFDRAEQDLQEWRCRLCYDNVRDTHNDWTNRSEHAEKHRYRACSQLVFKKSDSFVGHLKRIHGLERHNPQYILDACCYNPEKLNPS